MTGNIVVNLDFVRTGPSHTHRCRAFPFALAGLFLYCCVTPPTVYTYQRWNQVSRLGWVIGQSVRPGVWPGFEF